MTGPPWRLIKVWWVVLLLIQPALVYEASHQAACGVGLADCPSSLFFASAAVATLATLTELWAAPRARSWGRVLSCMFTWLNILDVCTDSLFLGVVIASENCSSCMIDDLYSRMTSLPTSEGDNGLFTKRAIVTWLVASMQFCGAAYAIWWRKKFQLGSDLLGFEILACCELDSFQQQEEPRKQGASSGHGGDEQTDDPLLFGAEVGEETLCCTPGYLQVQLDDDTVPEDSFVGQGSSDPGCVAVMFRDRLVAKIWLRLVLENALQLMLQTKLIGLSVNLVGWNTPTYKMLGFTTISAFFLFLKSCEAAPILRDRLEKGSGTTALWLYRCVAFSLFCILLVNIAIYVALFACPSHVLLINGCAAPLAAT